MERHPLSARDGLRFDPSPWMLAAGGMLVMWALAIAVCEFVIRVPGAALGGHVNDFVVEALPSLRQLYAGHLVASVQTAPAYLGSLVVRAPFAMLGMALGSGWITIYLLTVLPCVIAGPILTAWLSSRRATISEFPARRLWLWLSPCGVLLAINPVFIYSIVLGHPEEVVGACLAIAAVLQAARGRSGWAALLVGLAVANKSWAFVAVPVVLAVSPRIRLRDLLVIVVPICAVYGTQTMLTGGGADTGASVGTIFMPAQLWWFFGSHFWVAQHAHQLILVSSVVLSALWRFTRGADVRTTARRGQDALLLLALVLLLRAAMDPWDNIYYQLPFLMTVYALEFGRPPRASLLVTLALAAGTLPLAGVTPQSHAIAYQLAVVPLISGLSLRAFLSRASWERLLAALGAQRGLAGPGVLVAGPRS